MPNPVSTVIPVYNERRGLPDTLPRLGSLLEKLPEGSEIILVDDGSTDNSFKFLEKADLPHAVRVLRHPRNLGYGAALKTGIAAARNETIAICDADGTYPMERIPEFARMMESKEAAMVIGARPAGEQPAHRRPAKWVLQMLASQLTGERIPDMNSGLRLFRRADALRLKRLLPDGFSFTTTMTMALLTEGEFVLFPPIRYETRLGQSKIKPIRDSANFLLLICRTALAFHPMRVFGPAGLALIALGMVLLLLRLVLPEPAGVASTITLLIGGLQVLAIGLLADLINRRGIGI